MTATTEQTRQVSPTKAEGTVRDASGVLLAVPPGWVLLPPGDPALTRRVKAAGPVWTMQEKRGRKVFSLGMYAPAERIAQLRAALEREREDPSYTRKLEQGRQRRARAEASYTLEFSAEVLAFLRFAPRYRALGVAMAKAIAAHATPVGSGTVARTQRISVDRRAEAATIAWLRHATTTYDSMQIARVRGLRREVRRSLALQSRALLDRYRRGDVIADDVCPLRRALEGKV
jgi:hypothetical protein